MGIGPSLYHPPAIASLSRKFPDKRGFAISLHGTGGSVGEVVGPILTGALLTGTYFVIFEWRDILHISIIPALIFAVMVYLMMRNIPTEEIAKTSVREYYAGVFQLLPKPAMLVLVVVTALRSMGQNAIITFLPLYLRQGEDIGGLGYTAFTVGLFMSTAQVAGIGAKPVMGYISDRFGRKIVLVPAMTVLGVLFIALKFADPGWQLVLVVLAMGSFLYSLHTIVIAGAIDVSEGQSQSTVVALIYGASFFGTFSPYLAGLIADATVITNAFVYAGAIVLGSTVLLAVTKLPKTANQLASNGSAEPAINTDGLLAYSPFQQGSGYVSASRAITLGQNECANEGLDIARDIAGEEHYQGPAIVEEGNTVSLPGLNKILSTQVAATGYSPTRKWGLRLVSTLSVSLLTY